MPGGVYPHVPGRQPGGEIEGRIVRESPRPEGLPVGDADEVGPHRVGLQDHEAVPVAMGPVDRHAAALAVDHHGRAVHGPGIEEMHLAGKVAKDEGRPVRRAVGILEDPYLVHAGWEYRGVEVHAQVQLVRAPHSVPGELGEAALGEEVEGGPGPVGGEGELVPAPALGGHLPARLVGADQDLGAAVGAHEMHRLAHERALRRHPPRSRRQDQACQHEGYGSICHA